MQAVDITSELFDTVNLSTAFDFYGNCLTARIATEQIDWANCSWVFAANQREARLNRFWKCSKQFLQVCFDSIFCEPWVFA